MKKLQKIELDILENNLGNINDELLLWFKENIGILNSSQKQSLFSYTQERNCLIVSATGSGKTLAAFLPLFDYLIKQAQQGETIKNKLFIIYICPIKALVNNLQEHLLRFCKEIFELTGVKITSLIRTNDTTAYDKTKTPNILLTTPEGLAIFLSSQSNLLKAVNTKFLVVDEVHAIAGTKRGVQLSLCISHLHRLCNLKQIFGLSATVSPVEEIGKFLFNNTDFDLILGSEIKLLEVVCSTPKLNAFEDSLEAIFEMCKQLYSIIRKEEATLVFSNNRSLAEIIANNLQLLDSSLAVATHHSSLAKEERENVEQKLNQGKLDAVISAATLEQGIDYACVSKVVLCLSPKKADRAIQRIGRAGHKMNEVTRGVLFALDKGGILEIAAIAKCIKHKIIEKITIPKNCLDMLAQAILNICFNETLTFDQIYEFATSASCYRTISRENVQLVINFLLALDRAEKTRFLFARLRCVDDKYYSVRGDKKIEFLVNSGAIVKENEVKVKVNNVVIGTFDPSYASLIKKDSLFRMSGKTLKFKYIKGETIFAEMSENSSGDIPIWKSEMLPLSFEVACEMNILLDLFIKYFKLYKNKSEIFTLLESYSFDTLAFNEAYGHVYKQFQWLKINNIENMLFENDLLIEVFPENKSGTVLRVLIHSCFGQNFNALLSIILAHKIFENTKHSFNISCSDYGVSFNLEKEYLDTVIHTLTLKDLFADLNTTFFEAEIFKSLFFNRYFKRCAYRFLAILKNNKKTSIPDYILLNMLKGNELIIKEAIREILHDYLNFTGFVQKVQLIKSENMKIVSVDFPSPMAYDVLSKLETLTQKVGPNFLKTINHQIEVISQQEFLSLMLTTGDKLILFPCGSILCIEEKKYLIVGDLHLGLEYSLMKKYRFTGIDNSAHYAQLWEIFNQFKIDKTILLGDIKESISGYTTLELEEVKQFLDFILKFSEQVIVTQGNHDAVLAQGLGLITHELIIENEFISTEPIIFTYEYVINGYCFFHGHRKLRTEQNKSYTFSCHIHPRVDLKDSKGCKKTYMSILLLQNEDFVSIVLPTISSFKAGAPLEKVYSVEKANENSKYYIFDKEIKSWFSGNLKAYLESSDTAKNNNDQ